MQDPEPQRSMGEESPREAPPEDHPEIEGIRDRLRERSRSLREAPQPDPTLPWRLWISAAVLFVLILPLFTDVFIPMLLSDEGPRSPNYWADWSRNHSSADAFWLYYLTLGGLAVMVNARGRWRRPLLSTWPGYLYIAIGLAIAIWFGHMADFYLLLASLGLTAMAERAVKTPRRIGTTMSVRPPGWSRIVIFTLAMLAPALSIQLLVDAAGLIASAVTILVPLQAGLLLGFLRMDDDRRGMGLIAMGSLAAGAFAGLMLLGPLGFLLGILASPLYFTAMLPAAMVGFAIRRSFSGAP